MKIAIVNFLPFENLKPSLDSLEKMHEEIIDANIDFYTDMDYMEQLEEEKYVKNSYPLRLKGLSFLDYKDKYKNLRFYAKQNKYDIAIDTQCSFKSAFATYIISGRTAGFREKTFKGKLIAKLFYDEVVEIKDKSEIADKTKLLLSKPFGFDID